MESSDAREPSRTGGRSLLSSRPALAAAAVVLVAISGSLAWWGRGAVDGDSVAAAGAAATALPVRAVGLSESPVNPRLAGELERLESVVEEARGRLDANTIQVLERNLVLVERAIEDSYRALALDPENEFVREHLERSYQRKADFLRDVSRMAEIAG